MFCASAKKKRTGFAKREINILIYALFVFPDVPLSSRFQHLPKTVAPVRCIYLTAFAVLNRLAVPSNAEIWTSSESHDCFARHFGETVPKLISWWRASNRFPAPVFSLDNFVFCNAPNSVIRRAEIRAVAGPRIQQPKLVPFFGPPCEGFRRVRNSAVSLRRVISTQKPFSTPGLFAFLAVSEFLTRSISAPSRLATAPPPP